MIIGRTFGRIGLLALPTLLLALVSVTGCGGGPEIAPVSGVITVNGEPLAGARINTQPRAIGEGVGAGIGSFAVTDEQGRYRLELTQPPKPGAVVGTHTVRIKSQKASYKPGMDDAPTYEAAAQLPPRATDGSLTLEVPPGGTKAANFDFY